MLTHARREHARIDDLPAEPAPRPRRRWTRPDVPRPEAPKPRPVEGLSRRAAVVASLAGLGLGVVGLCLPAQGCPAVLSPNDARLVALADAYEALDREVNATLSTAPGFDDLVDGYLPIEEALFNTPADGLPGVMAKARALQVRSLREAGALDVALSLADDAHRLFGAGALS